MGYKNRTQARLETETCLSETLLFATMCIIGLPVDVHVRDGSVYSGIFHTASVDKDYGIVLKEAKLTRKGKLVANVANGSVMETLVILSCDLVQVVAKGVLFPADGINGNVASDYVEAAVVEVPSSEILENEAKESNKSAVDKKKLNDNRISAENKITSANGFLPNKVLKEHDGRKFTNHSVIAMEVDLRKKDMTDISKSEEAPGASVLGRQIGDERSQGEHDHQKQKFQLQREKSDDEVQSSNSISVLCLSEGKTIEEGRGTRKLSPNGLSCGNAVGSSISTASSPLVEVTSESHSGSLSSSADVISSQSSESTKISKEFKLNPGAKIFCPSFATPISANAVPAVSSMAYVPSNSSMIPAVAVAVAAAQPEVAISPFAPRPSVTAKFAPYTNLAAVNSGAGPQFSQPIVGHMGNRTQPLRYAGQYHAVQAAPAYVPPNSQAVVVGRLGQLVYVQSVPHDLIHSTATISPISARPLLTPHQVQYPKHQGSATGQALQMCAPPPFIASGQQPFAMPNHIPLLQPPIPANRAIPVPGSNALFSTKFP
ncbi:polyadenylate-binding protein-interacting protein 4 isoform X5 [Ricinus communis]|uniref:polyadenylate-binding protein-interacting protein 4 isoform X5 n=1 Tax=Ricinus communis TaxID=3988 RepID=UPI00201B13D9|nr:polyadenylate-binding protein-interacting protein 4 isoform X5 [Ricinus communis]